MSTHLTDEQLSAHHDGALAAADAARADAHLTACESCCTRLARLAELDGALEGALAHELDETALADLTARVTARIDRERAPEPRAPWWRMLTPRVLAVAGGVAALVLVSVLMLRPSRPADEARPMPALTERVAPAAQSRARTADS